MHKTWKNGLVVCTGYLIVYLGVFSFQTFGLCRILNMKIRTYVCTYVYMQAES